MGQMLDLFPKPCTALTLPDFPLAVSDSGLSELPGVRDTWLAWGVAGGLSLLETPVHCLVLEPLPQPVAV